MREHYLIGRALREKYIIKNKFLSRIYDNEEIEVRSSQTTRTIKSAESQLIGLYYESGSTIKKKANISYQIPPLNFNDNWSKYMKVLLI